MSGKAERPKVPKFDTEAEEARWWDQHMGMVEHELMKAMAAGTVRRGTALKLTRQVRSARNITIRMPEKDLERLHRLADKKGIGYQTYMKMLVREALDREERPELKSRRRKTA